MYALREKLKRGGSKFTLNDLSVKWAFRLREVTLFKGTKESQARFDSFRLRIHKRAKTLKHPDP